VGALEKRVTELEAKLAQIRVLPPPPDPAADEKDSSFAKRIEAVRMELLAAIYELEDQLSALESKVAMLPIAQLADQLEQLGAQVERDRGRLTALEVEKAGVEEVDALRTELARLEQQLERLSAQLEETRAQARNRQPLLA